LRNHLNAKCYFEDGRVAKSGQEFVELLKAESEGSIDTRTFNHAYSVDLDPTQGGEHVQAGFTGTSEKDGLTEKKQIHGSYYIVDGKIVMWTQYSTAILGE
jgi:hypothetical protein